jgi:NADH:ubiquinone oxidoreductase subunit 3 (subunit A)
MAFLVLKSHFADQLMPGTLPVIHFDNVVVLLVISILILARIVLWRNVSHQRSGPGENPTPKEREESEKSFTLRAMFYVAFLIHVIAVVGITWLACRGRTGAPQLPSVLTWLWDSPTRLLHCLLGASWEECGGGFLHRVLISSFWIWPFLFLISAVVRKLLVQFVGDVTAYIASNKIDRFEAIRKKIKDAAKESASAVYLAKANSRNDFEYGKVAIVGHSLGSVIAYDTLDRLIADDALATGMTGITRRTCLFLTFGSPLDKIAFFFSVMGKSTKHIREQLAAVVQPLIQDYKNRPFPWVNVYSRNDIICGHLDFYDLPDTLIPPGVKAVQNMRDEDALIPLVAHVEYWNNRTVWNQLLAEITR